MPPGRWYAARAAHPSHAGHPGSAWRLFSSGYVQPNSSPTAARMKAGTQRRRRRRVPLIVLAVALAFASGATDVTSFLRLGGVFGSVMTGNLVLLGLAVARTSGGLAAHTAVAFAGYIAGVALASRICAGVRRKNVLWPATVTATLLVELVVFAGFATGWELIGSRPVGASQYALLAVASLAMGLQSEAIRNVGTALSTTYLTGTLTTSVASIVTGRRSDRGNRMNVAVLAAAVAGAAAGGGLLSAAPALMPVLPLAAIAAVVTVAVTVGMH